MKPVVHQGGWLILATFLAAFILAIVPLPGLLQFVRPEWSALILIYWCMAIPERIGVGYGWIAGLFLDVLKGTLLGQHALCMAVLAYLVINLHQRIRLFPLWQQAIVVWMLLNLYQLLLLWFDGITGQPSKGLQFWLPPIAGMVLWPWIFILLRHFRRTFKVQ
ncbi:MAG TPA: rod shape-determining protein MreD [Gammaproteobacteria bacterium]|nr:rod shape-determining protein MreD [Gammaproteobacteria bacterium]